MANEQPNVCVFAPCVYVTITIEDTSDIDGDDIHIHPGGQGLWVSRMLRHLGERPILCCPIGGETGTVIRSLVAEWDIDLGAEVVATASPAYVDDRRSGERVNLAQGVAGELSRHELDDVYGAVLDRSIASGLCVVTGRVSENFPLEVYERLGSDLAATEVATVADIHGDELDAFLAGGPITTLKISDEDLDLAADPVDEDSIIRAMRGLQERGAKNVIVSRASEPTLARFGDDILRARTPSMEVVDHRGAGDSMTAALTAAVIRGYDPEATLKIATASGAANVTRHGLGSASVDLIEQLAAKVEVAHFASTT